MIASIATGAAFVALLCFALAWLVDREWEDME